MKKYVIRCSNIPLAEGTVFEMEDDATENEVSQAAFQCVIEYLDYTWEEMEDDDV